MRFLRISNTCINYAHSFYERRPGLAAASFAEQRAAFEQDHFGWGNAYTDALSSIGYVSEEFVGDVGPLQRAWAKEHAASSESWTAERIILEQVRWFRPDVLQFEINDGRLLNEIRASVPSIRLVLGWEGSALSTGKGWSGMDLILCCAPEAVSAMRGMGLRSEHLNHAFDPAVRERMHAPERDIAVSFIGSIIRRNQFHNERDRILATLCKRVPIEIFSPSVDADLKTYAKAFAAGAAYFLTGGLKLLGLTQPPCATGRLAQAYRVASIPRLPINPKLQKHLRPAAFGLDYYQIMHDSRVTLNIHADSSPTHASNIRLFEVTGVGSCLLTDYRDNITNLFEPDTEVVTYRSADECVEKAKWLLDHAAARAAIAARGLARTDRDHTFRKRVRELDEILQRALAGKAGACAVSVC